VTALDLASPPRTPPSLRSTPNFSICFSLDLVFEYPKLLWRAVATIAFSSSEASLSVWGTPRLNKAVDPSPPPSHRPFLIRLVPPRGQFELPLTIKTIVARIFEPALGSSWGLFFPQAPPRGDGPPLIFFLVRSLPRKPFPRLDECSAIPSFKQGLGLNLLVRSFPKPQTRIRFMSKLWPLLGLVDGFHFQLSPPWFFSNSSMYLMPKDTRSSTTCG